MQLAYDVRNPKENVMWLAESEFFSVADPSLNLTLPVDRRQ